MEILEKEKKRKDAGSLTKMKCCKHHSSFTATIIRAWPHYHLCWHEVID